MYPIYNQFNDYKYPNYQQPQIISRAVTNIEEAKATIISPFSYNLFLDTANGKIYLKNINNNGQSQFLVYSIENQQYEKNPIDEINQRLTNIENFLGGLKNDKSVSSVADDKQSDASNATTVNEQNATITENESAGLPKNARNDKWKR